jgi:enoyl-CoA hydratase/carnithine racemase
MSTELILTKTDGAVFEIQLNRADKMNALTDAMYGTLIEKLNQAEADDSIKVIVLRSSSKHFSAGNDLADFLETEFNFDSNVVQFLVCLARLNKPIIAAITGAAVGIGTTMLLHCDFILASASAKFSLPFIKLGLTPEGGSSQMLADRCGIAKTNDWLFSGRNILADEALSSGLVNQVFENDEATWQAASEQAQNLSRSSSEVLNTTKFLLKGEYVEDVVNLIRHEALVFAERLKSDEAQAAFAAFLKR